MQLQDLASHASRPGAGVEREAFGKLLSAKVVDSSVPQPARVWIVRQLEYMGAAESVEALTKVMNDEDAELRGMCSSRPGEKILPRLPQ